MVDVFLAALFDMSTIYGQFPEDSYGYWSLLSTANMV